MHTLCFCIRIRVAHGGASFRAFGWLVLGRDCDARLLGKLPLLAACMVAALKSDAAIQPVWAAKAKLCVTQSKTGRRMISDCSIFLPRCPVVDNVIFRVRVLSNPFDPSRRRLLVCSNALPGSNSDDTCFVRFASDWYGNYLDPAGVSERREARDLFRRHNSRDAFWKVE